MLSIDHIYNTIRNLKPEYQGILLSQYNFYDLRTLLEKDIVEYDRYLTSIINSAEKYFKLFGALVDLYIGVRKEQESDIMASMSQAYDRLSEEDKKKVCGAMMGKKEFFSDAYKNMMDVFQKAMKSEKENNNIVGSDVEKSM